jgi:nucleoside-diphosphate kinase
VPPEQLEAEKRPQEIEMDDEACQGREGHLTETFNPKDVHSYPPEALKDKTLVVVKPDAFRRRLVGEVIRRFEAKGMDVLELKKVTLTRSQAEEFYSVHSGKPFFEKLVSSISSGPVVAMVLQVPPERDTRGKTAVEVVRLMIGATNPAEASPGSIRGDLGIDITDNVVHASDSVESFVKEVSVVFG